MKTKFFASVFAVIAALAMGIAASAFQSEQKTNVVPESTVDHYIRYDGTDNSNLQIQASGNWQDLGTEEPELECGSVSGKPCFVKYNGDITAFRSYVASKTFSDLQTAGMIQDYRN